MSNIYPYLNKFSKYINIDKNDLVKAYEIESHYHNLIRNEKNHKKRKLFYKEMYSKAHKIYNRNSDYMSSELFSRKALLFKKELIGNSVLDVGCGKGAFLNTISNNFKFKNLVGIDVSLPEKDQLKKMSNIEFIEKDITCFNLNRKFDVVYSNHVVEHMSDHDLMTHLQSTVNHLKRGGVLIINMPNRLFGPSDVSRIIDFSCSNKIQSSGSHFNEMTYSQIIELLRKLGLRNFRSPFPHTLARHLIRNFRLRSELITWIENSPSLMKLLYIVKFNGRCRLNFEVSVICNL